MEGFWTAMRDEVTLTEQSRAPSRFFDGDHTLLGSVTRIGQPLRRDGEG